MALTQSFWIQKNKQQLLLLFVEHTLQIGGTKGTLTANTHNTTNAKAGALEARGNNRWSDIDMNEYVRRLCKQGRLKEALDVLNVMDQRCIPADSSTYASVLQECVDRKALAEGKLVHARMVDTEFDIGVYLRTKLVILYVNCGKLVDARQVFDEMPQRNVVSWTALIAAYTRHGYNEEALTLYYQMQRTGTPPNHFTFASVLPACADLASLEHGKNVHGDIVSYGLQSNVFVGNSLVDMYVKCGRIEDARQVFDKMPERDVVSCNAMIAGYIQNGYIDEALKLFQKMLERDVVSWNSMIVGHARIGRVDKAFKLFQKMFEKNVVSWNAMIAGYAQNRHVDEALKLFEKMPERNVVSWNAMIGGYPQNGHSNEAVKLFKRMQLTELKPDSITFSGILPAFSNLAALKHGKEVHGTVIRSGFQSDISVGCALVDMYAKCGRMYAACQVFDEMPVQDAASWNAMIAGYTQNGHVHQALNLFLKMPKRDVVSWNAMISGYTRNGYFNEALKLIPQMQLTGVKPDSVTFTSILPACASLAALEIGKEVHESIIRNGFLSDIYVGSALVDMYAKCGTIENACKVFYRMPERGLVSWNAMLVGYAIHGHGKEALQLFEQMQQSGMKPNGVSFIGVLSACGHAGLVDDAWQYFDCMSRDYHIAPAVDHYCCMVDLFGRAGLLDEAQDFINRMPIQPNAAVWGSLLGACRIHTNIEMAEHAAERLFELQPKNAAFYVLLSNIYAAVGRWDDVEKVRKMMKARGVKKTPGCSWIEINNKVYSFLIRDRSRP